MPVSNITESILIVDDTPSIVAFVEAVIEDQGYCAYTATSGTEALIIASEKRPDLILLDIMMPDVDGYTICSQLKANDKTKEIPIIFMSALNSAFDKIKAFRCGAVDYITKPIQSEELTARLKTHLTISKLNRDLMLTNRDLEEKVKERTKSLEESNSRMKELNFQLEQTLFKYKEAKEKAELAEKTKTEFLANITHEIRTPMNAIIGFTDLVKDNPDADQRNEYLAYIKNNAIKLLSMLNNILDFSQTVSGATVANFYHTNIAEVLDIVYKKNYLDAQAKGLEISIKNDNQEDFAITTDQNMLCQILNNLVDNSLKFSDKGTIEIGASNSNGTAIFYVKDSGMGIDPKLHEKIFKPFEQGENTYTKSHSGTGIGLALVDSYVSILKGEIWFDSSPGVGTIFYISLPIHIDPANQERPEFDGVKVLVGEDEDVSFILLNEILQPLGINVVRAKTGKEIFELYRQHSDVDLIISNLSLPQMSGDEAMKLIRKMRPNITTVAQISYFSAEDKRAFAFSGCNGYIDKPANAIQVKEILRKFLKNKSK